MGSSHWMARATALALGLLLGFGLTACLDYDDEFAEYCARQGTCECEGGNCCAAKDQPCSASLPCCGSNACSVLDRCDDPVMLAFMPLTKDTQVISQPGGSQSITLRNSGGGTSKPIELRVFIPPRRLQMDLSGCAGRTLGKAESCSVVVTYPAGVPLEDDMAAVAAGEQGDDAWLVSPHIKVCVSAPCT